MKIRFGTLEEVAIGGYLMQTWYEDF